MSDSGSVGSEKISRVWYSLPDDSSVYYLEHQGDPIAIYPKSKAETILGFIVAPFEYDENSPAFLIPGRAQKLDTNACLNIEITRQNQNTETAFSYEQSDYHAACTQYIEEIKKGKLDKAILSRVLLEDDHNISRDDLFSQLCESNPNGFTYYLQLSGTGSWIGATPETLLESTKDELKTMSLAGTQKLSDHPGGQLGWGEKEIREQAIVTDYIENILQNSALDKFTKTGPDTIVAGPVIHLQTSFSASLKKLGSNRAEALWDIIKNLHPTPAVCGLPRDKALHLIREEEKHKRDLYTGFLGPIDLEGDTRLFVNLRCMRDLGDQFALYLGGGITAESEPDKEFEETALKARTLLSVIEKIRKFAP